MVTYKQKLLVLLLVVCFTLSFVQSGLALNFSLLTFESLLDKSPTIIVGQVAHKKDVQEHHLYTVNVLLQKKGVSVSQDITVQVLKWADEGKLNLGNVYLFFLTGSDPYEVVGIHQGIIAIDLEEQEYESRFYSVEEIDESFPLEDYIERLFTQQSVSGGLLKGGMANGGYSLYLLLFLLFIGSASTAYFITKKKRKLTN